MEQNRVLNQLYNSLMQVPHRNYKPLVDALQGALDAHPAFAGRAAVYTALNSKIRDQVDCAIIALLQADPSWPEFREAGQVLLLGNSVYDNIMPYSVDGLPPNRIFRVDNFIRKSDRKIPRRMRSIMTDYLTKVQENEKWFVSLVMYNRKNVKSAYFHYHIPMNDLSKQVIIDRNYPEGSSLDAIQKIANSKDVMEQARLIIEHKIPYRIAQTLFAEKIDATVGIALVDVMTPTEALNARQWVESSGLLSIPEVRDVYIAKVSDATASVASADFRKSAQGADEEVQAAVDAAKEKSVAEDKRIGGQTDIWLDVSSSMDNAIAVTPEFASRIWPLCDDVAIIAHNNSAWEIKVRDTGHPLQDVRQALRGTRASGGTVMSVCLRKSRELGRNPQRIIMLTDGGELEDGLANALVRYEQETGILPQIVMIRLNGMDDVLTPRLERRGFQVEKLVAQDSSGNIDYFVFDQVTAILQGDVPKSLVERIMEIELPYRGK